MSTQSDTSQHIHDKGKIDRYFHLMLNMADDDLDVYEYRLLGHYRRWCGANGEPFEESTRKTAKQCRMGVATVSRTRRKLAEKGWIVLHETEEGKISVILVDRMAENVARYSSKQCSSVEQPDGEQCSSVEQGRSSVEHIRNNIYRNNKNTDRSMPDGIDADGDQPKKQKKPRPRKPAFDVIGCYSFGIPIGDPIPRLTGGRIASILGELRASFALIDDNPELIKRAYEWYRADRPGLSYPATGPTVLKMLHEYRAALQQRTAAKEPEPDEPITIPAPKVDHRGFPV